MERGRILAGTSGYSYPEWKGSFYPVDLDEGEFLPFYAGKFSTVEVNNTFYRFPSAALLEGWRDRTPEGFTFALKAPRRITHDGRIEGAAPGTARDFVERASILGPKLGPVLFQLPPSLSLDEGRLERFLTALPAGRRYAFEFRHPSWFVEPVFALLGDAGATLCLSEGEDLDTPRVSPGPFSYLRLRKQEYMEEELDSWRRWIAGRLDEGRDAYVYLKHDEGGASPERALRILEGIEAGAGAAAARP